MLQGLALEKLHRDKRLFIAFADFVNRANVWMVKRGSGSRFAPKTGQRVGIAGEVFRQKLESDEPVQACVFGLVNHAHASATELLHNAIVRYGLADHVWPIMV